MIPNFDRIEAVNQGLLHFLESLPIEQVELVSTLLISNLANVVLATNKNLTKDSYFEHVKAFVGTDKVDCWQADNKNPLEGANHA